MENRRRREFVKKDRVDVVDLVWQSNAKAAKVAKTIGLTSQVVAAWIRQAAADAGSGRPQNCTSVEIAVFEKLRGKRKDVRMEHEVLKDGIVFKRSTRRGAQYF